MPPDRDPDALRKAVKAALRAAAMEFESANVNGDGSLALPQFSDMMKARTGDHSLTHEINVYILPSF